MRLIARCTSKRHRWRQAGTPENTRRQRSARRDGAQGPARGRTWAAGDLPFVDAGRNGLYVHDLAREVLVVDLGWRDPDRFAAYHDRARQHYLDRLDCPDPRTQAGALLDLIYLHPSLRAFLQPPDDSSALHLEPLGSSDVDPVTSMITRHEGSESGLIAQGWLTDRPDTWLVVRGLDRSPQGAVCLLPLESLGATEDPAVVAP